MVGSMVRVVKVDGATEEYGRWETCGSCGTFLCGGGCRHGSQEGVAEQDGVDQVAGAEGQEGGGADAGGPAVPTLTGTLTIPLEAVDPEVLEVLFGGPVIPLYALPIPGKGQE